MPYRFAPSLEELPAAGDSFSPTPSPVEPALSLKVLPAAAAGPRRPFGPFSEAWTHQQLQELLNLFLNQRLPRPEIAARLGRTAKAVARKLEKLRLTRRVDPAAPWTRAEEARLRELWTQTTAPREALAAQLGRSEASIRRKVQKLGLRADQRPGGGAPQGPCEADAAAARVLIPFSPAGGPHRMACGPRRPWCSLDEARLRELLTLNGPADPLDRIAQALGRTPKAIGHKLKRLGLQRPAPTGAGAPWTAAELDALRVLHERFAGEVRHVAAQLDRTPRAVRRRLRQLGLAPATPPLAPPWSPEEEADLRTLLDAKVPHRLAGPLLERTPHAVQGKVRRLARRMARLRASEPTLFDNLPLGPNAGLRRADAEPAPPEPPAAPWDDASRELLRRALSKGTSLTVGHATTLLNRPRRAIILEALALGLDLHGRLVQTPAAGERQAAKAELEQLVLNLQTAYPQRDQAGGNERLNDYFDRLARIFAPELSQHAAYFSRSLNGATQVRDDLLSLGRTTLLETLLAWKPEKGTAFSRRQVSLCIKNRMRKFALLENRLVRLSPTVLRDVIKLNRCEGPEAEGAFLEALRQEGRTSGYINRVLNHRQAARSDATCAFLNEEERDAEFPGCASPVETDEQALADLASHRHATVDPAVLIKDAREVMLDAIEELKPAEQRAILLRFNLTQGLDPDQRQATLLRFNLSDEIDDHELTFREMKALTRVSPQRNNQVFAAALKRLKVKLAQRGIHRLSDCLPG